MNILEELKITKSPDYKRGTFIYVGVCKVKEHTIWVSVAYNIDYCIDKVLQAEKVDPLLKIDHINKIKVGELEACDRINRNEINEWIKEYRNGK